MPVHDSRMTRIAVLGQFGESPPSLKLLSHLTSRTRRHGYQPKPPQIHRPNIIFIITFLGVLSYEGVSVKLANCSFQSGRTGRSGSGRAFLRNLFSDPAIISLPGDRAQAAGAVHRPTACALARKIYDHLGGRSPILEETQSQARALEAALRTLELEAKAFVAMRYWHPFSDGAAQAVRQFAPDQIVLLPLYPQYSTTTSASSLKDWDRAAHEGRSCEADDPRVLLSGQSGFHRRAGGENPRRDGKPHAGIFLSPAAFGAWPAQAHGRKRRSLSMAGGANRAGPCGSRWG